MTPEQLQEAIFEQLRKSGLISDLNIGEIVVERPKNREHGDWATNFAMKLVKKTDFPNPRLFAENTIELIELIDGVDSVEIAGPGFINIRLNSASSAKIIETIINLGNSFGNNTDLKGKTINLEFVSANPTGPLHIGGVRWAAVGDALARILQANGAKCVREYYFNDHGSQIDNFAKSLYAAANGLPTPENGYAGEYINDIANQVVSNFGKPVSEITLEQFRADGVEIMFPQIKKSLIDFGVRFDVFFHEQSLYDSGAVEKAIEKLGSKGDVYQKDGATWIATSKYGDDKDRVVVKSDGEEAYFAADIAYYLDKRTRKIDPADKAIYMLGADHGGYISRLEAVCKAFGDTPGENLQVLLGQLVNLKKGGQPFKMSKRAGTVVTLEDLVELVGKDAARYSLARVSTDTTFDLDLDLIASHSNENPVYYVQYAFARTKNVERNFASHFQIENSQIAAKVTAGLKYLEKLDDKTEEELLANLAQFPSVVQVSASQLSPHKIARYLESLAASYHSWYATCRVIGDGVDENLSLARLALNFATSQVLLNALTLLGVSAPEKM